MVMGRGNQNQPPMPQRPARPAPPPPEAQLPSRELHPAAQEAVARYSAVWDENDRLRADNQRLEGENDVLRKVDAEKSSMLSDLRRTLEETQRAADDRVNRTEAHFRERLVAAELGKERYLRYAVTLSERLKACSEQIAAAHDVAMEMANTKGQLDRVEDDIAAEIARLAKPEGGNHG